MESTSYQLQNSDGENFQETGKICEKKVILFSRYPVAGQTKTRLIPSLGPQGAATLQKRLTEMAVETVQAFQQIRKVDFEIRYTNGEKIHLQQWIGPDKTYRDQGKGNLGKRIQLAFSESFNNQVGRVLIIGADCPSITQEHLDQSLSLLTSNDLVLGPASDGGYYLIGLSGEHPSLFDNIAWGTSAVCAETIKKATDLSLKTVLLEELEDIDRPGDLKMLPKKLRRYL